MLDVYLFDTCVGMLGARGRGLRFQYTPEALEDDALFPISLALPKQGEPFPDSRAGPFFRNLLPEQAYRRLVAAAGLLFTVARHNAIDANYPDISLYWYWDQSGNVIMR